MNKLIFGAVALVALTACSSLTDEPEMERMEAVTLTFSPYTMDDMTRAATSIANYCTRLDVWISDGGETTEAHQESTDADFGTVTLPLNKTKTYTLVAVAHKCTDAATLADGVIAFQDDKITHAMVYTTTFSPADSNTLSCLMTRIVGMFRMETTDAVPADCKKFKFTFACNDRWDVSGVSTHPSSKEININVTSTHDDGTVALSFYIMPSNLTDTDLVDVTATALTASDEVIETKTFEDVPVKAGYRTTYRGAFFTTEQMTMTFMVDDWQDFDAVTF